MKNYFLPIALSLSCLSGKSQPITFHFSDSLYCEEDDAHGFVYLHEIKDNSVTTQQGTFQITFPKGFEANDTAFYHEYFMGHPGAVPRGVGMLITNYESASPTLYLDSNNNLNFGDDDKPIHFSDSSAYFTFSGKPDLQAQFGIRYWINKIDTFGINYLDKSFQIEVLNERGIGLMSSEYWFNSKRHNNKILKTTLNGDSIKIAIHDYNVNGRFNDVNSDMIFINDVEIPFDSNPTSGCITLDSTTTLFSFHNQVYQVIEIDPFGRFITIEPSNLAYKTPLGPGDMMPNLKLPTPSGDSLSLKSMLDGQHYLVIDMWADWCKPCRESAPRLKEFAKKHKDKITMLGVSPHNIN